MSLQQCEECRLALVRVVFDPAAGELPRWSCQLDESFSEQTRDVSCPFHVAWSADLPPPERSCKKSQGRIDGCSTSGGCSSCGSEGCGSGGCGMGDPAEALEMKWDPEAEEPQEPAPPEAPAREPEVAPGVRGDPSAPEGQAPHPADDGNPCSAKGCGALGFLDRLGLGRDEDAPVPIPLED